MDKAKEIKKLEKRLLELKTENVIEVNFWYKVEEEEDTLWYITSVNGSTAYGYGICCGEWNNQTDSCLLYTSDAADE